MENKDKKHDPSEDLQHLSFVKNPHDKYARYSLQIRELAIAFFQYALSDAIKSLLDWDSLQLSNDSFIDEHLQGHYTDICYTGSTLDSQPFRISLLLEHKSEPPKSGEITEQIGRYIFNGRREDIKNKRPLTLIIPIVLYHGTQRLRAETPLTIFPSVPSTLHKYVPAFEYEIVDLVSRSEEDLNEIDFSPLRHFLLALKYSRNEKKIALFWTDFLNFAASVDGQLVYIRFVIVTARYLSTTSKTFQKRISNMNTATATREEKVFHSILEDRFEEAWTKGIEQGVKQGVEIGVKQGVEIGVKQGVEIGVKQGVEIVVRTFIIKNPQLTDQQIAEIFDLPQDFVKKVRDTL